MLATALTAILRNAAVSKSAAKNSQFSRLYVIRHAADQVRYSRTHSPEISPVWARGLAGGLPAPWSRLPRDAGLARRARDRRFDNVVSHITRMVAGFGRGFPGYRPLVAYQKPPLSARPRSGCRA